MLIPSSIFVIKDPAFPSCSTILNLWRATPKATCGRIPHLLAVFKSVSSRFSFIFIFVCLKLGYVRQPLNNVKWGSPSWPGPVKINPTGALGIWAFQPVHASGCIFGWQSESVCYSEMRMTFCFFHKPKHYLDIFVNVSESVSLGN